MIISTLLYTVIISFFSFDTVLISTRFFNTAFNTFSSLFTLC